MRPRSVFYRQKSDYGIAMSLLELVAFTFWNLRRHARHPRPFSPLHSMKSESDETAQPSPESAQQKQQAAEQQAAQQQEVQKNANEVRHPLMKYVLSLILIFSLVFLVTLLSVRLRPVGLEIVAGAQSEATSPLPHGEAQKAPSERWTISGVVLKGGQPVSGVPVWAVVSDESGNRHVSRSVSTDKVGTFSLADIPSALGSASQGVESATVHAATITTSWWWPSATGEYTLYLNSNPKFRLFRPAPMSFIPILIVSLFIASLVVGMINFKTSEWRKIKYWVSIILAIIYTIAMLGLVGWGQFEVNKTAHSGEALSLGVATIFEGTYVEHLTPEWVLSFTAPPVRKIEAMAPVDPNKASPDALSRGLGAPLWVILFAVIGSALFTVVLLVKEIESPPDFDENKPDPTRLRIRELVFNQLYLLFAPLGGIFIYQILVLADAVTQPVTVAIAALGAGATLNILLARAIGAAETAVKGMSAATHGGSK
jgi:hypothetical protein